MTLARERAMATAYLLGGDEDVREGVAAAQDMGGRVVLITIPGSKRAFTLVAEADEELALPESFWRPHFSRPTPAQMEAELPKELAPPEPATSAVSAGPPVSGPIRDAFQKATAETGGEFAWEWGRDASIEEIRAVLAQPSYRIPPEIDRLLLVAADRELGFLRDNPDLKSPLRLGFKAELHKVLVDRERGDGQAAEAIEPTSG